MLILSMAVVVLSIRHSAAEETCANTIRLQADHTHINSQCAPVGQTLSWLQYSKLLFAGFADQAEVGGKEFEVLLQVDYRVGAQAPRLLSISIPSAIWRDIWWARRYEIGLLCLMLATLGAILVFQNAVVSWVKFYRRVRVLYLALTFVFLGLFANAQLTVVNVITFIHALMSGFRWDLFLLDPMVFILWSFVAASMLFWGRGVFCGWLCPFGALQELINDLAQRLKLPQITIAYGLQERLWMIKYLAFLIILAVSLHSVTAAFGFAEIEPFKTVITLKFIRDWPFIIYAAGLLIVGLFLERFFCRYLCPLGAAMAIPARMRMFEWLKRYRECGTECQICARRCTVQAIHPLGQINPSECLYCLECQAVYCDKSLCLHLLRREARRSRKSQRSTESPSESQYAGSA